MPHAAVSILYGRSQEVKERVAARIQQVLSEELSVRPELVSVSVEDFQDEPLQAHIAGFKDSMLISPAYLEKKHPEAEKADELSASANEEADEEDAVEPAKIKVISRPNTCKKTTTMGIKDIDKDE